MSFGNTYNKLRDKIGKRVNMKKMKKKKKDVPMLIIDDSQYKDEPINRDPDTSMEISEELQAKLDEIRKQFKF